MTDIIFEYEGVLDKYMGDAMMAIFGVPVRHDDHASRAVSAAVKMLDEHKKFCAELDEAKRFGMRIGINTGEVVAGYMGAARRMEYTVLGRPVVVAKRLESMAEVNSIYVGPQTYREGRESFDFHCLGKMKSPKGEEVEAYRVSGRKS